MAMKLRYIILIISATALMTLNCNGGDGWFEVNCDDEIDDAVNSLGPPEEVNKYDTEDGYHSWDYWWWSKGINYSFTWGTNVSGCEVSTYTFEPIG
jgi:hypothetical protein